MEIKSIMKTRNMGEIDYIYRDIDSLAEIADKKVYGVHAYCFCKGKFIVVYADKKGYWTPAGGGVEKDESVEDAVAREVKEETNMRVLSQKVIGYIEVDERDRVVVQTRHFCIVEPCGPFECDPDGDITKIELIDPKDYKKYFDWGEVGDHMMKRAIQMHEEYIGR